MADAAPGLPREELKALVARAKSGDRAAFGVLVEHYYRMVSILAYQKVKNRADAEDLVQESFVRAYRAIESLREPEKFGGWLYHIAVKICLDHLRKRDRHDPPLRLDDVGAPSDGAASPALASLEQREEESKVAGAISSLPEKYRTVVTLRFVEKRSYREIAELLGEPDGTIANRIHRAVKLLQGTIRGVPGELEESSPAGVAEDEAEA
jgi:RNA polymerase sigma-70 factor (ECF subfamily)